MQSRKYALFFCLFSLFLPNLALADDFMDLMLEVKPRPILGANNETIHKTKISLSLFDADQQQVIARETESNNLKIPHVSFRFKNIERSRIKDLLSDGKLCFKTEVTREGTPYKNYVIFPMCFYTIVDVKNLHKEFADLIPYDDVKDKTSGSMLNKIDNFDKKGDPAYIVSAVEEFEDYVALVGKDYVGEVDINWFAVLFGKVINANVASSISSDWFSLDMLGNENPATKISDESAVGIVAEIIERLIDQKDVRDDVIALYNAHISYANISNAFKIDSAAGINSSKHSDFLKSAFSFAISFAKNVPEDKGVPLLNYFNKCVEYADHKVKSIASSCIAHIDVEKISTVKDHLSESQRKTIVAKFANALRCPKDGAAIPSKQSSLVTETSLEVLRGLFTLAECNRSSCKAGPNPCGINATEASVY